MSKYNEYVRKLDNLARSSFEAYAKAKETYDKAEKRYKEDRRPSSGIWVADAERIARAAHAEGDWVTAQDTFKKAKMEYERSLDEVDRIRAELEQRINADMIANPAALDANTLELLKSGILKPQEYAHLLEKNSDNPTMRRMIGEYARQRAAAAERDNDRQARAAFNVVAQDAQNSDGRQYLEVFDAISGVYRRCVNNPAMIGHWESLTAEPIKNF